MARSKRAALTSWLRPTFSIHCGCLGTPIGEPPPKGVPAQSGGFARLKIKIFDLSNPP